uniref:Phosphate-specific transport system accessory protein PhoU n=1 Tax=uncultured bacterium F25-01 TaxID=1191433 RepID=I3VIG2_9BACT|nr:phosphate transport system regulatory protein PhoU [uncultured bacterium F25-01]
MAGRESFERELRRLQDEMLLLASMVDRAIGDSVDALKRLDVEAAKQIIDGDGPINAKRYLIEESAVTTIATQQPMARDLRTILAVLHISIELERMGDYAAGIAKIVLMHGDQDLLKPLIDIPRMADMDRSMLRRSIDAFVNRDVELARRVGAEDDIIDAFQDQVYRELLTYVMQDPRTINRATWLIWVVHNLERIADRVTNICERVVFLVTGQIQEINASQH